MTSKSLNTTLNWLLDRHLECIICKDKYNEPKALNCMHTFCQGCLLDYYKDTNVKPCPVCKKPTQLPEEGVPALKANFVINSLLDDFSTLKVVDSSDKQSEDLVKCEQHTECFKLYYCVPCKKAICRKCAVTDHPETGAHGVIDCEDAALELKKSLQDVFPDRKKDIETCDRSLKESLKVRQHLHDRVEMTISVVRAKAAEVIAQVTREEEQLIDDIGTLERDRNARFDEHEETVTKMLQEKQYTLEAAEDIVKNCSDSTFLDLYPDMSSLTSSQPVPQIDRRLSRLTFEQSTCNVELGTIDKEGKRKLYAEVKWELCNKFGTFYGVKAVVPLSQSDDLVVVLKTTRFLIINDSTGKTVTSIVIEADAVSDIVEVGDRLAVVNGSDLVSVYNKDGTLAFKFFTYFKFWGWKRQNKVSLLSLAVVKNGFIMVGDTKRNVITQHDPHDGSLLRTMSVNLKPEFLAIDSKDRIVISDFDGCVDVVDDNGATLITIEVTIDSIKARPNGVRCDSSGIYIIVQPKGGFARHHHHHIHHYNTEGRFLNCIVQDHDLNDPLGITFTSDGQRLAVWGDDSVKIYRKVLS